MERLFSAIPTVLKHVESPSAVEEAIVFAAWSRCSGELLRERTATVEFVNNRLVIAVPDITWRRHLEDLSRQILVRINRLLGEGTVTFIEFRIDESAIDAIRRAGTTAGSIPDVSPSLRSAANAIADEALRNQFLSSAAYYLARQQP